MPYTERNALLSPWLGNLLGLRSAGAFYIQEGGYWFPVYESLMTPNSIPNGPAELILPGQYAGISAGISFFWDNNYQAAGRANPYTIDLSLPAELVPSSTVILDENLVEGESLADVTPISGNATIAYAGAVFPAQRTWEAAFQLEVSSVMSDLINPLPFRLIEATYREATNNGNETNIGDAVSGYYWLNMGRWQEYYENSATLAEGEAWSWALNESVPATFLYFPDGSPNAVYVLISRDRFSMSSGVTGELTSTVFDRSTYFYYMSGNDYVYNTAGVQIIAVDFVGVWPDLTFIANFSYTGPQGGGNVSVRVDIDTELRMFLPYDWY